MIDLMLVFLMVILRMSFAILLEGVFAYVSIYLLLEGVFKDVSNALLLDGDFAFVFCYSS
jgi:hypothetical protein